MGFSYSVSYQILLEVAIFGMVLFSSFFYLLYFATTGKEKSILFIGLFLLVSSIGLSLHSNISPVLFPQLSIKTITGSKYLIIGIGALLLVMYFSSVYSQEVSRGEAFLIIISTSILLLSISNDILYSYIHTNSKAFAQSLKTIIRNESLWPLGLFIFTFLQSGLLLKKYSKDLRRAEEKAEKLLILDRFKSDFLVYTSREIDILLHRIINLSESMLNIKSEQTKTQQIANLTKVISDCKKIEDLILNMLQYLQLKDKDEVPSSFKFLDLNISKETDSENSYSHIKKLQDEINKMEKSRRDMLTNISHDLRTPLTSIQGYIDAILEGFVESPEQQREYLKRAQARIAGLIKLVEELSTIVQLETKLVKLNFYPMYAAEIVRNVFEKYNMDVSSANLRLNMELHPEIIKKNPRVSVDFHKIDRVYANLINNAVRHTPSGGTVTLGARLLGNEVIFEVSDTGVGIDKNDLPHVFDRFFMGSKARSSITGNSGLGLSIAKEIIENHKGVIWVESEINKGTTFYFKLPVVPDGTRGRS